MKDFISGIASTSVPTVGIAGAGLVVMGVVANGIVFAGFVVPGSTSAFHHCPTPPTWRCDLHPLSFCPSSGWVLSPLSLLHSSQLSARLRLRLPQVAQPIKYPGHSP